MRPRTGAALQEDDRFLVVLPAHGSAPVRPGAAEAQGARHEVHESVPGTARPASARPASAREAAAGPEAAMRGRRRGAQGGGGAGHEAQHGSVGRPRAVALISPLLADGPASGVGIGNVGG